MANSQNTTGPARRGWLGPTFVGGIIVAVIGAVATLAAAEIGKSGDQGGAAASTPSPSHGSCDLLSIRPEFQRLDTTVSFPELSMDLNTGAKPPVVNFAGSYSGAIPAEDRLMSVHQADPASQDHLTPT